MTKLYLPLGILVHHLKQIEAGSVEIRPLVHGLHDDVHTSPMVITMLHVGALARPYIAFHQDSEGSRCGDRHETLVIQQSLESPLDLPSITESRLVTCCPMSTQTGLNRDCLFE